MDRSSLLKTTWVIMRVCVFTLIAACIFIFPVFFKNYAAFVVGGVMILYAVDDLVRIRVHHGRFRLMPAAIIDFASAFLGILMMIFLHSTAVNTEHLIKVCTIWASWSVLQSAFELWEFAGMFREKKLGLAGVIASAAVIVLSVLLLIDPEAHLQFHIVILGVDLILKYGLPLLYEFAYRAKQRKQAG